MCWTRTRASRSTPATATTRRSLRLPAHTTAVSPRCRTVWIGELTLRLSMQTVPLASRLVLEIARAHLTRFAEHCHGDCTPDETAEAKGQCEAKGVASRTRCSAAPTETGGDSATGMAARWAAAFAATASLAPAFFSSPYARLTIL